ncbi:glycosyltransferase family 4 protein [Clostridium tertium]
MKCKYICHIGPGEDVLGGISTVISDIMNSDLREEYKFQLIRTASYKRKLITFFKGLIKYIKLCVFNQVSLVHIHMSENGSCYRTMILIIVSKFFGNTVLVHSHGSEIEKFYFDLGDGFKKKLFNNILQKADCIVVLTPGWKKFWERIVKSEKIIIIPNSVTIPKELKKANNMNDKLKVLFLGKVGKRKGIYDLIDAMNILIKDKINVELFIGGDGELDKCNKYIEKLNLKNKVHLCGWVEKEKKENLLRDADLLVLPSYFESFGIVLLEAMAYKLPVICSNGGYMHEVVDDGIDGYIVPVNSPKNIADKIRYIDSHRDELIKMGHNGFSKVSSTYSYTDIMRSFGKIYDYYGKD